MKLVSTIVAALFLCAAAGCEPPAEPEETTDFDREIDGPPGLYAPPANEDLLADQAEVARRMASEAPAPAEWTAPTSSDPIQSLRQRLAEVKAAADAGRPEEFAELFPANVANALKQAFALKVSAKRQGLEQLVASRLGDNLTAEVKALSRYEVEQLLGQLESMMNSKHEVRGETIIITEAPGKKTTFTRTAGVWKAQLGPKEEQAFLLWGEVAAGESDLIDALTSGINKGFINKDNFKTTFNQLNGQLLKPKVEPWAKAVQEAMKESMGTPSPPAGPSF